MFHNLSRNVEMSQHTLHADVIHCHTWYTHLAGIFSRELLQSPLVLTTHSLETHRPWKVEQLGNGYFLSRWIENHAYNTADGIIAVSQQMKTDVIEAYGVSPERVTVIHNGIDPEYYKPTFDNDLLLEYGINPEIPFVLFVGRITRQKGLAHLLRAWQNVPAEYGLVLAAGSPDEETIGNEVKVLIEELQKTRANVIWIPDMLPHEKLCALLTSADLFICPSIYEPLGIVNLEAMACETAVLATRVGGIPEVVADGNTGKLVNYSGDGATLESDLESAIIELMKEPAVLKQYGEAGRKRAAAEFGWPAVARATLALYQSLIK
jgi:glycogen synthase